MATSPYDSVAHPPDAGLHPAGSLRDQRLADLHGRLSLALVRAKAAGAFVDPHLLIEMGDVVGEVLKLVGERPGRQYGCWETAHKGQASEPPRGESGPAGAGGLDP